MKEACIKCGRTSTLSYIRGKYYCQTCLDKAKQKVINGETSMIETMNVMIPMQMNEELGKRVVGQTKARKILCVAVYNHLKRTQMQACNPDIRLTKSNILMYGPTGCGKTHIVKMISELINVPLYIADATSLTATGYVGADVESILTGLLLAANGDVEKAEKGIIYIDEIDKIGRKGSGPSNTRDIGGEGVQQALLKIVEGAKIQVPVPGSRRSDMTTVTMDTTNILFICGGAFEGLNQIIEERTKEKVSLGFGSRAINAEQLEKTATAVDFEKYGMMSEFLGRFPIIAPIEELTKKNYIQIISSTKNCMMSEYEELFAREGILFHVTPKAIEMIADAAYEKKLGVRGMRGIFESLLLSPMYSVPGSQRAVMVKIDEISIEYGKANVTVKDDNDRIVPQNIEV